MEKQKVNRRLHQKVVRGLRCSVFHSFDQRPSQQIRDHCQSEPGGFWESIDLSAPQHKGIPAPKKRRGNPVHAHTEREGLECGGEGPPRSQSEKESPLQTLFLQILRRVRGDPEEAEEELLPTRQSQPGLRNSEGQAEGNCQQTRNEKGVRTGTWKGFERGHSRSFLRGHHLPWQKQYKPGCAFASTEGGSEGIQKRRRKEILQNQSLQKKNGRSSK